MGFKRVVGRALQKPPPEEYVLGMPIHEVPGHPRARFMKYHQDAEFEMCSVDIRSWRVLSPLEVNAFRPNRMLGRIA